MLYIHYTRFQSHFPKVNISVFLVVMDPNFRRTTLLKIAANAGLLTSFVEKELNPKPQFSSLGSVGPGTTVMMPSNPVKPDGSVDILINIRGIPGGDTKRASSLGVNAVIVTAEAGGKGNKENVVAYGNANFINNAVSQVLNFVQNKFPDKKIKRGKLVISGFSGGAGAVAAALTQRSSIKGGVDGVVLNDGLHADPNSPQMNAVLEYAKEAEKDPNKKLKVIHTAITPGKYISTTQTANYLLDQLSLQRKPTENWNGKGPKPKTEAKKGGVEIYQLFDKEPPYMVKDPNTGELKPNLIGDPNEPVTNGGQHIVANNSLEDYLAGLF